MQWPIHEPTRTSTPPTGTNSIDTKHDFLRFSTIPRLPCLYEAYLVIPAFVAGIFFFLENTTHLYYFMFWHFLFGGLHASQKHQLFLPSGRGRECTWNLILVCNENGNFMLQQCQGIPVPRQIIPQRMKVPSVNPYTDHKIKFTKP